MSKIFGQVNLDFCARLANLVLLSDTYDGDNWRVIPGNLCRAVCFFSFRGSFHEHVFVGNPIDGAKHSADDSSDILG